MNANNIKKALLKLMMGASHQIPFISGRVGHQVYPYMFTPQQLVFIMDNACSRLGMGSFVEAGVAYGATTIFLNKAFRALEQSPDYYAIDTFSGFTSSDIEFETTVRGKPANIANAFTVNNVAWFTKNLNLYDISNVQIFETDVTKFNFSQVDRIAFCLLDVDLYKPIINVLPKIYEKLAPGGIIIIDDVMEKNIFDGAQQAYKEFVDSNNLEYKVVHHKLGVIEKPLQATTI